MDLVMDSEKMSAAMATAAAMDAPLVLTSMAAQLGPQLMMGSSGVPSVVSSAPQQQHSFPGGVPTLLTPSQMSSLAISPVQQSSANSTSKYAQLLQVIEELGKDIRPTYSGSKSSAERLKRGIIHARILVRECLIETERNNSRN